MINKADQERYKQAAEIITNGEDLISFVEWYADRLGLTSFIDEFGNEVESDLKEKIDELSRTWDDELDQPTRNWKLYNQELYKEEQEQELAYRRDV